VLGDFLIYDAICLLKQKTLSESLRINLTNSRIYVEIDSNIDFSTLEAHRRIDSRPAPYYAGLHDLDQTFAALDCCFVKFFGKKIKKVVL